MKVVGIGRGTDVINELPAAPKYFSKEQKKHWRDSGQLLIRSGLMKEKFVAALELFAVAKAQFEWAIIEINKKNAIEPGKGYVQTFKTGATNITTEMVVRNDAQDSMIKCLKMFGLDPKSEKDLKNTTDPNQTNLFEALMELKKSAG